VDVFFNGCGRTAENLIWTIRKLLFLGYQALLAYCTNGHTYVTSLCLVSLGR